MEYQVPQFIEVEDKIFGPLSLKQFIYVAGGVGICVVIILYIHPLVLGIIIAAPVAALTGALAFYKINNKPFVEILEAGFNFLSGNRLYLWQKDKVEHPQAAPAPEAAVRQKLGLSRGKLHELAWSLDIQDQEQQGGGPVAPLK